MLAHPDRFFKQVFGESLARVPFAGGAGWGQGRTRTAVTNRRIPQLLTEGERMGKRSVSSGAAAAVFVTLLLGCSAWGQDAGVADRVFAERSAPARLHFISFDVPRAYPGLPYYTRTAVVGGRWPYTFELVKRPEGARITADRGEVFWKPTREGEVALFEVKATDRAGKSVTRRWSVRVTRSGFCFVAGNGDDRTGDGTIGKPYRTIQQAINKAHGVGTVYVREGLYRERSRPKGSAGGYDEYTLIIGLGAYGLGHQKPTAQNPFVLASFPGERAVIEPDGPRHVAGETPIGIEILAPYVLIESLELRNCWNKGIRPAHADCLVVRGCEIHAVRGTSGNVAAIFRGTREMVVQDCRLYDHRHVLYKSGHCTPITLYRNTDALFEDNHIHDVPTSDGIIDKDGGRRNEFRGNVIHGCSAGIHVMGQSRHVDVRIHDNLVYDCNTTGHAPAGGITVGRHGHGVTGTRVHHNTVLGGLSNSNAKDTTVWNCIFQTPGLFATAVDPESCPGFVARRTVFHCPHPKGFKFGSFWKVPAIDFAAFVKLTVSKEVLSAEVQFENRHRNDYRPKMTPELTRLVGDGDYLGAHERVLKWAADGCPTRTRDTVLTRLDASESRY